MSDTNWAIDTEDRLKLESKVLEIRGIVQFTYVAKSNALISCHVTKQLFCSFVLTNTKSRFFMTRLTYVTMFVIVLVFILKE